MGSTLQQGGLVLQLTLHKAATMELLSDNHNPRLAMKGKGLLAITQKRKEEDNVVVEEEEGEEEVEAEGDKKKKKKKKTKENKKENKVRLEMPLTVRLTESSHTFEFFVTLMSSDTKSLIKIKVSPPNAVAGDPLCVVTRAFLSRARKPDDPEKEPRKKPLSMPALPAPVEAAPVQEAAVDDDGPHRYNALSADADEGPPPQLRSLGAGDDDGGATFRSCSAGGDEVEVSQEEVVVDEEEVDEDENDDDEDEDDEEEEEEEAAVLARTDSKTWVNQARTVDELQRLLSGLKSQQPMPSGPALLEALRVCRISG